MHELYFHVAGIEPTIWCNCIAVRRPRFLLFTSAVSFSVQRVPPSASIRFIKTVSFSVALVSKRIPFLFKFFFALHPIHFRFRNLMVSQRC